MPETNEIRRNRVHEFENLADISPLKMRIYCYRGIVSDGAFMDTNPGKINKKRAPSS